MPTPGRSKILVALEQQQRDSARQLAAWRELCIRSRARRTAWFGIGKIVRVGRGRYQMARRCARLVSLDCLN